MFATGARNTRSFSVVAAYGTNVHFIVRDSFAGTWLDKELARGLAKGWGTVEMEVRTRRRAVLATLAMPYNSESDEPASTSPRVAPALCSLLGPRRRSRSLCTTARGTGTTTDRRITWCPGLERTASGTESSPCCRRPFPSWWCTPNSRRLAFNPPAAAQMSSLLRIGLLSSVGACSLCCDSSSLLSPPVPPDPTPVNPSARHLLPTHA